jgi:P4 family phage/plasmid primase-like protien
MSVHEFPGGRPETAPAPFLSQDDLALRFSLKHAAELRYIAVSGKWLQWQGDRWRTEETLRVFDLARLICREAATLSDNKKTKADITAARAVAAVVSLARADRRHATTIDQWDADPWVLNHEGGTRDLVNGFDAAHHPGFYITRIAASAVDLNMPIPLWNEFLETVAPDPDLRAYLQRVCGYCLTGLTTEHAMFFFYGTGNNGKGVFLNTLRGIWNDYAVVAPGEMFMESQTERHPTELARLLGVRLVIAQEIERNQRWAESKIKALTGGDPIAARFMRQDFFEYNPLFKLMVAGNNKPSLRGVDEAIRRRMHLIPFTVTIAKEKRDKDLSEKLKAEWPGILAWCVKGCLDWQKDGLKPPPAVAAATDAYLTAEDTIGAWIEECCGIDPIYTELSTKLYHNWKAWTEAAGERPGSQKRFSQSLIQRGFSQDRDPHTRQMMFKGIGLR